MPCAYQICTHTRLIRVRLWGAVNHSELIAARQEMMEDPAFDQRFSHLIDCSDVTVPDVNASQIQQMAANPPFVPGVRRAIVAPAAVTFGLARMYENYREPLSPGEQLRVFRSLQQAEEWLGLPSSVQAGAA